MSMAEPTPSELPPATPVHLAALIDYQRGSVASRTLKASAQGTITLFAFDRGESLSEHQVPFDAVVQVLDGTGCLTIGGRGVTAKVGETVRMPAHVPHAVHAVECFKMLLVMIRG